MSAALYLKDPAVARSFINQSMKNYPSFTHNNAHILLTFLGRQLSDVEKRELAAMSAALYLKDPAVARSFISQSMKNYPSITHNITHMFLGRQLSDVEKRELLLCLLPCT